MRRTGLKQRCKEESLMNKKWFSIIAALIAILYLGIAHAASTTLQIERFVYDGQTPTDEGDEYVKICNVSGSGVDLTGYKIGDEETKLGTESMYNLPATTLAAGSCIFIAKNANQFNTRYGFLPDYETIVSGGGMTDNAGIPNLSKYTSWSSGDWGLANGGDEIILLDPSDALVDGICYEAGTNNFNATGAGTIVSNACTNLNVGDGVGLKRGNTTDTDATTDFSVTLPNALTLRTLRASAPLSPWNVALPLLGLAAVGGLFAWRRRG